MGRRLPTVSELFETLVQVGYKTILHLAIDEDDFDATPFVEACLKVGWDWMRYAAVEITLFSSSSNDTMKPAGWRQC